MTTISDAEFRCPCCKSAFHTSLCMSTNQVGTTTDFRPITMGYSSLPLGVHTCPSCGYSGQYGNFGENEITDELRAYVRERLTPIIRSQTISPWLKYELFARILEWRQAEAIAIADTYLRAAWCCVESGRELTASEKHYRQKAVQYFERAWHANEVSDDIKPNITYLIGELHRRLGDTERAADWFDRVPEVIGIIRDNEWLIEAAHRQKTDPLDQFP